MADFEIRDLKGNLKGFISKYTSGSSGDDNIEPWIWRGIGILAIIGAVGGFIEAGIGGAILWAILFPLISVALIAWVCFIVIEVLPWLILLGIISGIIWLIGTFWGIGN